MRPCPDGFISQPFGFIRREAGSSDLIIETLFTHISWLTLVLPQEGPTHEPALDVTADGVAPQVAVIISGLVVWPFIREPPSLAGA